MSMEIVYGYVCKDCSDVARAKKGEDPATKPNSPDGVNRPLASGDRGTQVNLIL